MDRIFRCISCGYTSANYSTRCPVCGFIMETISRDLEWSVIEEEPSIWRYEDLLPASKGKISLSEGLTPLRRLEGILIKDETKNPTSSYVDRGSSVLVSCLQLPASIEMDFMQDVTVSLSTYFLKKGIRVRVNINPEGTELTELLYLSKLGVEIRFGSRDKTVYESPYMIEGFKTISYEIFEQKETVDGVVVPSETGILAYGILKGFFELEEMGLMKPPNLFLAYHGEPKAKLLQILEDKGAKLIEVDADKALSSLVDLARRGMYVKPIAAMAYSAVKELGGENIAVLTGSGIRKWFYEEDKPLTDLQNRILGILRDRGEMTAYQIWRNMEEVTLQGVYKALSKLTELGLVKSRRVMSKRRKIRLYSVPRG